MFQKYTEEARSSIFFARYEANLFRAPLVEPEHLLLGLLMENTAFVNRFLNSKVSEDSIRGQILAVATERQSDSVDSPNMPFSKESKRVFSSAEEEAERMVSQFVGIEHLLLGLLHDESSVAALMLNQHGVDVERIRKELEDAPYQAAPKEERTLRMMEGIREILTAVPSQFFQSLEGASGQTGRFEHFTEKARRTFFFAQCEASQLCSPKVESEHLLLGIMREGIPHFDVFLPLASSKEALRRQIEGYSVARKKIQVNPGLPLSEECERALDNAEEEATKLKHKRAGLEHLLLGLLRVEGCIAAQILQKNGADVKRIRTELAIRPNQSDQDT